MSSAGAVVSRMPRPSAGRGQVLVRVEYSLVSVGTEIAPLRSLAADAGGGGRLEQAGAYASLARRYLGKAVKDPKKAYRRVKSIVRRELQRFKPPAGSAATRKSVDDLTWEKADAREFEPLESGFRVVTDESECNYQVVSTTFGVSEGQWPAVELLGHVKRGAVMIGVLNSGRTEWLGSHKFTEGKIDDRIVFDPKGSEEVTICITTAGAGSSEVQLDQVQAQLIPATDAGISQNEMGDQGWPVGYSAAGTVIAVGEDVEDLVAGDRVACGGAAYAHHADYVAVPRNLCAKVPAGCDTRLASTTTVGTIALQGVRRTEPQLGDKVVVLGLGLIGQITAQLLQANGAFVLGLDLDPSRVERAIELGIDAAVSDPAEMAGLVRDHTQGLGADATIITAATRSSQVTNQAMQLTRRRGKVVLVGDVGLNVERPEFYKKEIDLLMSTSYGPGRYDSVYEEGGKDYPYSYVRWTLNRNMQAYLDLIAGGRLNIDRLIDREISVDEAPQAYKELARGGNDLPLGVLFRFPEESGLPEAQDAKQIRLRGHRRAPADGPVHYALVGAGAFGTCMLVPQMDKRRDCFFLRAVVSRDGAKGGNFAREHRVEKFAGHIDDVLSDPELDLVVISTRHSEHAEQVIASLKAGKHVFVEKPLALTWEELQAIEETYSSLESPPQLMVGFNRRFSPALEELRKIIADRRSPMIINYRLNGGYIPLDSWMQTDVGGGRNLGEACHMYDVFRSLARTPVKSIRASAIEPGDLPYLKTDNFCATLTYEDGSVGNLIYTALGPKKGLPKERIEIFVDGEAYLVDDFKKLVRTSDNTTLWQASEADKGHQEELSRFGDALLNGSESPIPFSEIIETSAVALHIEDQLHGHGEELGD